VLTLLARFRLEQAQGVEAPPSSKQLDELDVDDLLLMLRAGLAPQVAKGGDGGDKVSSLPRSALVWTDS
jgi:hypothetical protein